ncbi:MAG: hypothetical protein QOD98_4133 [Nocardioidaceae bacterium]|nr:hypothetical protein [Nocardioidaceae bacterium]
MKVRSAVVLVTVWACTVAVVALVTWQVIHTAGRGVLADPSGPAVTQDAVPTPSPSPDSIWRPAHQHPARPAPGPSSTATSPSAAPSSGGSQPSSSSHPTGAPSHGDSNGPATGPSHSSSPGSGHSSHDGTPTSTPSPSTTPPGPSVDSWRGEAGVLTVSCSSSRIRLLGATPADGYRVEVEQEEHRVQAHFQREDPADEVQVMAHCSGGLPQFEVEQDDRSHDEPSSASLTS